MESAVVYYPQLFNNQYTAALAENAAAVLSLITFLSHSPSILLLLLSFSCFNPVLIQMRTVMCEYD